MKKQAINLINGDVINPPKHEQKWLKNNLTVIELEEGFPDKKGRWLIARCSFKSPYSPNYSEMKIKLRPSTEINILDMDTTENGKSFKELLYEGMKKGCEETRAEVK